VLKQIQIKKSFFCFWRRERCCLFSNSIWKEWFRGNWCHL